jgi:hypothetical protein
LTYFSRQLKCASLAKCQSEESMTTVVKIMNKTAAPSAVYVGTIRGRENMEAIAYGCRLLQRIYGGNFSTQAKMAEVDNIAGAMMQELSRLRREVRGE